jgi:hypothetical protein
VSGDRDVGHHPAGCGHRLIAEGADRDLKPGQFNRE